QGLCGLKYGGEEEVRTKQPSSPYSAVIADLNGCFTHDRHSAADIMAENLELQGGTWHVLLAIPKDLQKAVGGRKILSQ
ncbi:hypothetical protein, partial [Pseudomonas syringae]|uniref:hypothetical protein n=1 Tax=Pseudomonas syringae TaxID=317 RepID=UPI001C3F2DCF